MYRTIGMLGCTALLAAMPVRAQMVVPNSVTLTVSAGASVPSGVTSKSFKTGYALAAALDLRIPATQFGLRGEATYENLDAKGLSGTGVSGSTSAAGLNANVVFWLVAPTSLTPGLYLTAGPSYDRLDVSASGGTSSSTFSVTENHAGFNGGVGVDFPLGSLAFRVDARYKQINTSGDGLRTIPLTVGLRF